MRSVGKPALLVVVLSMSAGLCKGGELKGTVKALGVKDSGDAVVYVDTIPGKTFPAPGTHALMDQKNLVFIPHVLPVLVGTTVDFRNSDAILHNVFSPDKCADKFNLGSWPQNQTRPHTFNAVCFATLLCNVHPEMEAFVVVLPTPYFAVTDKSGAYSIKDVPDGSYTVKVWHPKLKETSKPITVAGPTTADFQIQR